MPGLSSARLHRILRRLVLALIFALSAGLIAPHLWAWHQLRAGHDALDQNHNQVALDHLDSCLKIWPNSYSAHLFAARACWRTEQFERSDRHLQECRRVLGKSTEELVFEQALLRATTGDLDPQIEEYLQARTQKPQFAPLALEALAVGYLRIYRILEALACLNRWISYDPDQARAYELRGKVWRQAKVPQNAVPDYRRVVELDPENADAHWYLGLGLVEIGRYDEALEHLEFVERQRPNDLDLLVAKARSHSGLGRPDEANSLLDRVLTIDPEHGPALRARGQTALMTHDAAAAETWLRKALRALPHDYQTNFSLYQALQQQEKLAEAKEQMARVQKVQARLERMNEIMTRKMSTTPHAPELHYELGMLLLSAGHKDVGETWLLSALREKPDFRSAHVALAEFYEAEGNAQKATYHREQAAKIP